MKGWKAGPLRWAGIAVVLSSIVLGTCPPYYGAATNAAGQLHTALGHHPRWATPSAGEICSALAERQRRQGLGATVRCSPAAQLGTQFEARVNTVRLGAELAGVLLVSSAIASLAIRQRTRPHDS